MADTGTLYAKRSGQGPSHVTDEDFAAAALHLEPLRTGTVRLTYAVLVGASLYDADALGHAILGEAAVNPQNVVLAARAVGLETFSRVRVDADGKVFAPAQEDKARYTF